MNQDIDSAIRGIFPPRRIVHRGVVESAALLYDTDLLGIHEARQRVLRRSDASTRVWRTEAGYLLRLPRPIFVDTSVCEGIPLVETNGILTALPLTDHEWDALRPASGSFVIARHGAIVVMQPGDAEREDPASWLDVSGYAPVEVYDLGPALQAAEPVLEAPPFRGRERLTGAPASEETARIEALLAAITQEAQQGRRAPTGADAEGNGLRRAVGRTLAGATAAAARGLLRMLGRPPQKGDPNASGAARAGRAGHAGTTAAKRTRTPLDRLADAIRRIGMRAAIASGLARAIGRKQAEYVAHMMEMFRSGDVDQALRHAIPLGGPCGLHTALQSLRLPTPRADLGIFPWQTQAGSYIGGGPDLFKELERLYRRAFEQLVEEGRIEEAAFVLAELLNSNEEAVAFLEKHGRLRLAAEMAEARGLAAGLIVRLWFLAGDKDRAILIARRMGAFPDAVHRIERTDKGKGAILRLLWADSLAEAGDYYGAVIAAWPLPEARRIAANWLERGIAAGGPSGASMLIMKLSLIPGDADEVVRMAREILEDGSEDGAAARSEIFSTLRIIEGTAPVRFLARLATRSLLRDLARGLGHSEADLVGTLVQIAGDGALSADVPAVPRISRPILRDRTEPIEIHLAASDGGTLPVCDAAFLPDGKAVVALGEIGLRLLTADGRTVAHWDQPVHRLVLSDLGDRAIGLAPRGYVQRLTRIDFAARKVEYWCEAPVTAHAHNYDGSLWFAAVGDDFVMVDALAPSVRALWRRPGIGQTVASIARSDSRCSILTHTPQHTDEWGQPTMPWIKTERWTFTLPGPVLQRQIGVEITRRDRQEAVYRAVGLNAEGVVAELSAIAPDEPGGTKADPIWTLCLEPWKERTLALAPATQIDPIVPIFVGDWALVSVPEGDGAITHVVHISRPDVLIRMRAEGVSHSRARMRSGEGKLTICDERGRLLVIDLADGRLVRNLRVS